MKIAVEQIDLPQLLSLYGADLVVVMAKLPQELADSMLDDLVAGIKEEADAIRKGRAIEAAVKS